MGDRSPSSEAQVYAADLEYTLKELQRKVREHETELEKVSVRRAAKSKPRTSWLTLNVSDTVHPGGDPFAT